MPPSIGQHHSLEALATDPTSDIAGPRDGNDADHTYLREARNALQQALVVSAAVSTGTADPELRNLAATAFAAQTAQLRSVSSRLSAWSSAAPSVGPDRPLDAVHPDVPALSHAQFLDHLTTLGQVALVAARSEMVKGLDRQARRLAEDAVRFYSATGSDPSIEARLS